jgi:hypothetical protein
LKDPPTSKNGGDLRIQKGVSGLMRSKVIKVLLACGIVSSALYIGTDILASMLYPDTSRRSATAHL